MTRFAYDIVQDQNPKLGLIVLQTDERIEQDFRQLLPASVNLFVSRVPSGADVTPDTLQEMEGHVPAAARLFPGGRKFDAIGYGCTSGTAQIGQSRIAELVREGAETGAVTDPLTALVAACAELKTSRLAFLSPYLETVSDRLRAALSDNGVETPVFGTFAEAKEEKVARISPESLFDAAKELARSDQVDGLFLSCTNLNTLGIIGELEAATGVPVLSSNLVLAWHLTRHAGQTTGICCDCRLTQNKQSQAGIG